MRPPTPRRCSVMRSIPVITTNIAGIPEMFEHGTHGYCYDPEDAKGFQQAMTELGEAGPKGQRHRLQMGAAAKKHATDTFTNSQMVSQYRASELLLPCSFSHMLAVALLWSHKACLIAVSLELSPPVVLLDMDGVVVDWDRGFATAWAGRTDIKRNDYSMEKCVPLEYQDQARAVFHADGFFANLPPMPGEHARSHPTSICTHTLLPDP